MDNILLGIREIITTCDKYSEDVDIAINREFFGFSGEIFTIKKISKDLRKATCKFIRDNLQFDLARQMEANKIPANLFSVRMDISPITTVDPEKIFIEYKSVFIKNPYIKNTVILEIGGRSMKEPIQEVKLQSLINNYFPTATFAEKQFTVKAVTPERTFLEKIFLLHEEFAKPKDLIRTERISRHFYDISQILETSIAENALNNKELYHSIIAHRRIFIALKDFDYNTLRPDKINIIPPFNIIDQWEEDYNKMQTMIYGYAPDFKTMIEKIKRLNKKINKINFLN